MDFITYAIIVIAALLLVSTVTLALLLRKLSLRLNRLTLGTNGKNLEESIFRLMDDHVIFQNRVERIEETTGRINSELKSSIRGVATVRFNAFSDVGGKQSFATALVAEDGSGVIVSSLYARERVNVYAKPIVNFQSEYELSVEEARALKEACKIFN
jgi:hypothetical protein